MSITPERIKELDDKVREIGTFLNMAFDEEYIAKHERSWNYYSELKNGTKALGFSTGDYKFKDRWHIRAIFPRDDKGQLNTTYNAKWPEMTVSMTKTSEQIAKNIKSRLVPEYEKQLADVLLKIEKANKYYSGRKETIKAISNYLGQEEPKEGKETVYPNYASREDRADRVYKIEAYSENTVKFDVECSSEKAIEILKLLGY